MTKPYRTALVPPEGELALISDQLVELAIAHSRASPRKRVIQPFHKRPDDPLHRMLNAVQPGSYVRPHRHLQPPKSEAFVVLRGSLVFFSFTDDGQVRDCARLVAGGTRFGVDLEPGVYHCFVALEPDTVIYEVKNGPYDQATDKAFAPFAPEEGRPESVAYMHGLLDEYRRRAGLSAHGLAGVAYRPPPLYTERLLLRGYEPSDAADIHHYCADVETTRYMAFDRHRSIEDAYVFLNGWVASCYRTGQLDYALCLCDRPERVIGGLGLRADSAQPGSLELGYILAREYWGRGFMPEAARRLMAHAFETTAVARIEAPIFAENARSRRAAEKMGMRLDGVLRASRALRGRRWDVAVYSLLRGEL